MSGTIPVHARHRMAHLERREALARILVAQAMGLIHDVRGERQAEEFWGRYIDKAEAILLLTAPRIEQ